MNTHRRTKARLDDTRYMETSDVFRPALPPRKGVLIDLRPGHHEMILCTKLPGRDRRSVCGEKPLSRAIASTTKTVDMRTTVSRATAVDRTGGAGREHLTKAAERNLWPYIEE